MGDQFNAAELHVISSMGRASKMLPDDYWGVAVMQELAVLIAELSPKLTDEQTAILIGTGAYLMKVTHDETMAGIKAAIAIQNAMTTP